MHNRIQPLLFDEFDIKEMSTTETLKLGKRAFNNGSISNVTVTKLSIQGVYTRGSTTKKVKITRKNARLFGTIDDTLTKPFTAPLTALSFWYVDYINDNKPINLVDNTPDHRTLEPFQSLQIFFEYDAVHHKINISLYQPKTHTYCNESHLFIHSFIQLIQHFPPNIQTILDHLQIHFEESFFYTLTWFKFDEGLSKKVLFLIKNKALYTEKNTLISMAEQSIHLKVTCQIIDHQILISFIWVTANKAHQIPVQDALQCSYSHHIIYKTKCYIIDNPVHSKIASQFKGSSFQRLDIAKITPFITKLVQLRKQSGIELAIDPNIQKLSSLSIAPICIVDATPLQDGGSLYISYQYNDITVTASNPTPYIIFDDFSYTQRDIQKEHAFRDILLHYHPSSTEDDSIYYHAPYFDHVLGDIKTKCIEGIRFSKTSAKMFVLSKDIIQPTIQLKSTSKHKTSFSIQWKNNANKSLTHSLQHHIQLGIHHYFDPVSQTIIPIQSLALLSPLSTTENLTIPVGIALYIAVHTTLQITVPKQLQNDVTLLKNMSKLSIPAAIKNTLRPFQNKGLQWLLSIYKSSLNGILADDMGLGKTIQSIMLLHTLYIQSKALPPTLIVMPKTLLFNWDNEFQKFAPKLKILLYDGPKRKSLIPEFNDYHIIMASYASLRIDIAQLKEIPFHMVILDEAQYAKNSTTNTFKAIKKLKSDHRLLLTGTPLENSIGDLWSLMDIANPNYFGPYKQYEEFYSDVHHQPLLKAAIHPLMLRRKKADVLNDLPPVTIQELWATPTPSERQEYIKFATQEWNAIETIVASKGLEKSKIHIFSLMTKLRQWCAHPSLILETKEDGPKWLLFYDRLEESISSGHKVVVFSQFIPMIKLIESRLTAENIGYVSLTGQTKNRADVIQNFNNNPAIRVGIFSLKAGGVGINLTSADYVFLYDPWWNPAVEQQAIDRVHRMGQTHPVTVFKCLVSSTIEERMITYQEHKKELIDSLIEERSITDLNVDDIKSLIGI
jgi:hypothetical protein